MTHEACVAVSRDVSLWLDGRLDATERAVFDAHVASCAGCSSLVANARAVDALARAALPPVEPPPGLVAAIERRALVASPPAPRRWWSGLSFAAGLLVGLGLATPAILRGHAVTAPVPAVSPALDAPIQRFAVASDALLTDLVELSGEDPARDLALLREETAVLDIGGAVRSLRTALPTLRATDAILARQAERAADGTEAISLALAAPAAATGSASGAAIRLFELRDEAERLELPATVRGLARGGLPRPRVFASAASAPALAASSDPAYLEGLALYAQGDLDGARARWEAAARSSTGDPSSLARASYWTARAHVLEGRPDRAVAFLRPVVATRPFALHGTPLGAAIHASFFDAALPFKRPMPGLPPHDPGHVIVVERTRVPGPGHRVFGMHGLPPDLEDVVLHLGPDDPELRIERLLSVRADGREVPLTEDGRETLRSLGPIIARRLGPQGRVAIVPGERGHVTVTLRLADVRLLTPETRHFAKTLGDALGEPVVGEDGTSRVKRVDLQGTEP